MTARINDEGKLEFSRHVSWAALGVLVSVLGSLALGFIWVGKIGERLDSNARYDDAHHHDPSLHMPWSDKVAHFWTRSEGQRVEAAIRESDTRQRQILDALARIEQEISGR